MTRPCKSKQVSRVRPRKHFLS
uniref:Uncharacterized protein n=1 Tax=Ciona intestinalis TaxID=7719 RepID=H2XQG3_CIOIN